MSSMIIATDLSDNSQVAIKTGLEWAKTHQLSPIVVYVEPPLFPEHELTFRGLAKNLAELEVEEGLRKKIINHLKPLIDEACPVEIWKGNPVKCLLESIQDNKASLIAMGLTGQNLFKDILVGSHTQKLVELSPVSVLCIHHEINSLPKKPLYCCDFLKSNDYALQTALDVSARGDNVLDILHVVSPQTIIDQENADININSLQAAIDNSVSIAYDEISKLAKSFQGKTRTFITSSSQTNVGEQIIQHAQKEGNDLIILGTHSYHGMKKWLLGSSAEFVVKKANRSILVCKK